MSDRCALCFVHSTLCNSHIIPEFLYEEMYDDKHRFHMRSASSPGKARQHQKGIYEKLLCDKCEAKLSTYERYAKHVFVGVEPVEASRQNNLIEIRGLDYTKFRLFGLSILWRASVATHEFFKSVSLGPHEPRIRQMIHEADPGDPQEYGFFLSPLVAGERDATDLIIQPTRSRLGDNRCYRFVFGGLIWIFVVSSHNPPEPFRKAFLDHSGRMLMLVSELKDTSFVRDTMAKALGVET